MVRRRNEIISDFHFCFISLTYQSLSLTFHRPYDLIRTNSKDIIFSIMFEKIPQIGYCNLRLTKRSSSITQIEINNFENMPSPGSGRPYIFENMPSSGYERPYIFEKMPSPGSGRPYIFENLIVHVLYKVNILCNFINILNKRRHYAI